MAMPGRMKSRSVPTPFRMAPELATCSEMFLFLQRTGIPENASNKGDIDRRMTPPAPHMQQYYLVCHANLSLLLGLSLYIAL